MKTADLPWLRQKKSKGKVYWYFERHGSRVRLPDPTDRMFLTAYQEAEAGRIRVPASARSFIALVKSYLESERFLSKAPRTQKDYRRMCEYIRENIGKHRPDRMIRGDVIGAMQANRHRPQHANHLLQMLSILFEHANDIGWMVGNPAKGVSKLKAGDGYKPWPEPLLERFIANAPDDVRLLAELGIGTGQRAGDLLKMRWSDIEREDGQMTGILLKQGKTGAELFIPLTDRLRKVLESAPRNGMTIITGQNGQAMSYDSAQKKVRAHADKHNAKGFTIHGWRYTAAGQLLDAGCSDAQIAAITGHASMEMVHKYSRKGKQRKLAQAAQEKRKG